MVLLTKRRAAERGGDPAEPGDPHGDDQHEGRSRGRWLLGDIARRFRRNRLATVSLIFLGLVVLSAILAPAIATHDPDAIDIGSRLSGPSAEHWLGSDDLGRDVFSRLVYASRVSLTAAVLAVGIGIGIGAPIGIVSGYVGKWFDVLLGRIADSMMSIPTLIFAIAVIAARGPGLFNAMLALGIVYSPRIYRVMRGTTMEVRREVYIQASRTIGTPTPWILRRHVLPNVASPLIVEASLLMSFALLAEASLSFLGFGVTPPDSSWGVMLGRAFLSINTAPLQIVWPGLAIAAAAFAFNAIGDGLRDSLGREVRGGGHS